MAKAKKEIKDEIVKTEKIAVGFYSEEYKAIIEKIEESGQELLGEDLNGRDIRVFFGLKPTHRSGVKTELKQEIGKLSREEQEEMLNNLKTKE